MLGRQPTHLRKVDASSSRELRRCPQYVLPCLTEANSILFLFDWMGFGFEAFSVQGMLSGFLKVYDVWFEGLPQDLPLNDYLRHDADDKTSSVCYSPPFSGENPNSAISTTRHGSVFVGGALFRSSCR